MARHAEKWAMENCGKIPKGHFYRLGIETLLVAVFLFTAQIAFAKRTGPGHEEFRFRLSGGYGEVHYTDSSPASNATTEFKDFHPGGSLGLEGWTAGDFGLALNSQLWSMNVNDKQLNYNANDALLVWRLFGPGGGMGSETVLMLGASLYYLPDWRSYPGLRNSDLLYPKVFAGTVGIRWRINVSKFWTVEFGGAYSHPFALVPAQNSALSRSDTRFIQGWFLADFQVSDGIGISFGADYQVIRLGYRPNGNFLNRPQSISIDIMSPLFSVRFWF